MFLCSFVWRRQDLASSAFDHAVGSDGANRDCGTKMNDDPPMLKFDEHRESANADARVRCPKCGSRIFMHDMRCEHCGIHFEGETWEFSPSTKQSLHSTMLGSARWILIVAVVVLLCLILSAFFRPL